jgi:hypothetical protein
MTVAAIITAAAELALRPRAELPGRLAPHHRGRR